LVTASGPHGGDADARRLGWALGDVARVHAVSVDILVVLVIVLVITLVREHAPRRVLTAASAALAVMAVQGVLGYVQYAKHIPEVLVGFHVFGAACVWTAVTQLILELRAPRTEPAVAIDEPAAVEVALGA
jgi:cytochrome c oxidase assembly protein subunit 15